MQRDSIRGIAPELDAARSAHARREGKNLNALALELPLYGVRLKDGVLRAVLFLPLLNALLPASLLRAGIARSGADGIVYLSPATRARFSALGLPPGRLLLPLRRAWLFPRLAAMFLPSPS